VGARAEARAEAEMVGEMEEVRVGAMGVERVGVERAAATVGAMEAETGVGMVEEREAAVGMVEEREAAVRARAAEARATAVAARAVAEEMAVAVRARVAAMAAERVAAVPGKLRLCQTRR